MITEKENVIILVGYKQVDENKPTFGLGVGWYCGDQGQCKLVYGVHICKKGKEDLFGELM